MLAEHTFSILFLSYYTQRRLKAGLKRLVPNVRGLHRNYSCFRILKAHNIMQIYIGRRVALSSHIKDKLFCCCLVVYKSYHLFHTCPNFTSTLICFILPSSLVISTISVCIVQII